jgi:putative phosphoribosyl transferase
MIYKDRTHAGQVLATFLKEYKDSSLLVLALVNGGIPVGLEIAKLLQLDFNLIFVSKITPRFNSEVGYGAVSETGIININEGLVRRFGLQEREVEQDLKNTKRKIAQRVKEFYLWEKRGSLFNREVLLVDDGIASGFTMLNAIETVKELKVKKVVVAVPTAPLVSYEKIAAATQEVICPDIQDVYSFAVADSYEHWYDISNEKAKIFLRNYGYIEDKTR